MFSVALSVSQAYGPLADIPLRPSLLASTLPCGVRTFLSPTPGACDPVRTEPASGKAAIARLARATFIIGPEVFWFKGDRTQRCGKMR